ncbi:MAG: flagellar basal body rod C-terminal domain-containing protein [Rhodoferax sp.]
MATNEMANVSTVGFKRSYEAATVATSLEGVGLKTRMQPQSFTTDYISLVAGPMMATGRELDVALNGNSVMGVTATNGDLAFTRRGDLHINAQGALENGGGHLVRGQSGEPISLPPGMKFSIRSDGSIYGVDPAQAGAAAPVQVGSLMLRDASETKLHRRTDGLYAPVDLPDGQDIPVSKTPPSLTGGALEGSNVNAMHTMIKLMDQSRSFEQLVNLMKESKNCYESGSTMMKAS